LHLSFGEKEDLLEISLIDEMDSWEFHKEAWTAARKQNGPTHVRDADLHANDFHLSSKQKNDSINAEGG
jgi:hypothetical protein